MSKKTRFINYQIGALNRKCRLSETLHMRTTALNLWCLSEVAQALVSLLSVFIFTFATPLRGETTNKRMIIPGARAQALAGAFTAVADDSSAGWHNPAGLGFLKGPGLNVTVNNYSRSKKTIKGVTNDQDLAENSASIYPGFAGANGQIGPFVLGWSYFTLEQQNTDESQTLTLANLNLSERRGIPLAGSVLQYERAELTTGSLIHAGASLAYSFSRNISLGLSEFYYRRQKQSNLKERSSFESGVFYDSFSRLSTKNEGTVAVAGVLIRGEDLAVGVAYRIPRALSDKTNYETSSIIYTGASPELSSDHMTTHREDELTTRTLSLGIAWTPLKTALMSADVIFHPATKTPWAQSGGFNTRSTTDWSLGVELRPSSLLIAGGAFSNNSLVSEPKPSLISPDPTQANYIGFSAALGFHSKQSENLFIMTRQRGSGKTQMVQGDLSLQDLIIESQTFSLSSSYKF